MRILKLYHSSFITLSTYLPQITFQNSEVYICGYNLLDCIAGDIVLLYVQEVVTQ